MVIMVEGMGLITAHSNDDEAYCARSRRKRQIYPSVHMKLIETDWVFATFLLPSLALRFVWDRQTAQVAILSATTILSVEFTPSPNKDSRARFRFH